MKKIDKTIIDNYKTELTESGQTSSYPEIKIIENKSQEDEKVNGINASVVCNVNGEEL